MELHEIQSMLKRLQDKENPTKQDLKNIEFLEDKIFEHIDEELGKRDDLCSYGE